MNQTRHANPQRRRTRPSTMLHALLAARVKVENAQSPLVRTLVNALARALPR